MYCIEIYPTGTADIDKGSFWLIDAVSFSKSVTITIDPDGTQANVTAVFYGHVPVGMDPGDFTEADLDNAGATALQTLILTEFAGFRSITWESRLVVIV